MSIKIMTAVWERSDLDQAETLVALALADHANDNGLCWPGLSRIAQKARLSERHVRRTLRSLEAKGVLETSLNRGRSKTNQYRFLKPDTVSVLSQKPDMEAQNRTFETEKPDITMSPKSSGTVIEPKSDEKSRAKAEEIRQRLRKTLKVVPT